MKNFLKGIFSAKKGDMIDVRQKKDRENDVNKIINRDYKIKERPNGYKNVMTLKKTSALSVKGGKSAVAKNASKAKPKSVSLKSPVANKEKSGNVVKKIPIKTKIQKQKNNIKIPMPKKSEVAVATVVAAKTGGKKELLFAPADVCFWVYNGPVLQSLLDLRDAFQTLTKEQYSYHANNDKNDFSAWVLHILQDKKCAHDLLKAKNMQGALKTVEKHLKEYDI